MVWMTPFSASWKRDGAGEGLYRTFSDEDDAGDEGDRQEDVEHAARDVDPEVADGRRVASSEAPHHGDRHGDADRRRDELLHRQGADLGEVRHRRLAAVVLPVGVGRERRRRVEAQGRADAVEVLGIQGQRTLDSNDHVGEGDGDGGEDDHRAGVALPGLFLLGTRAEHPVDRPFDEAEEVHPSVEDRRHVRTEETPGESQAHHEGENGEEETHLELLWLEHGEADVSEHHDGQGQEDDLRKTHTRSSAQMSPSIATAKPIMPSAEYRSAMDPVSRANP